LLLKYKQKGKTKIWIYRLYKKLVRCLPKEEAGGVAPETIDQALQEAGISVGPTTQKPASAAPAAMHHEKIIQPSPGFDPNAK
jgi:hypothetical protein